MVVFNKVNKNKYGFYQLINIPAPQELDEYYTQKYYQVAAGSYGSYGSSFSLEELQYINNKMEQKYHVLSNFIDISSSKLNKFLDIGSGKGWALKFFKERSWDVLGLDYSELGCLNHNPDYRENMVIGDIYDSIDKLIAVDKRFDCIWLDNVLEHVIDPFQLLDECRKLVTEHGIMVIEVPNDFSIVHKYLSENKYISRQFWVAEPEHISYFNREGLISICQEAGWKCLYTMGDFPIEFNLFNKNTNYAEDESKGKSCHLTRVVIENLLHSISVEKTNELYSILSMMGLGRQIIGYFTLENKE
jgi:2-polyprenyl-3-methyl-5-hydroxy-6-metoxy-1,4-benzoquinol methylase